MPVEPNPFDDEKLAAIRVDQKDPIVQYLVVRKSLDMSPGKIAAQCAHLGAMFILRYEEIRHSLGFPAGGLRKTQCDITKQWLDISFRKRVKKANDSQFERIKQELPVFVVRDAGLTEVDPGSETVLCTWPMRESSAPTLLTKLRNL